MLPTPFVHTGKGSDVLIIAKAQSRNTDYAQK